VRPWHGKVYNIKLLQASVPRSPLNPPQTVTRTPTIFTIKNNKIMKNTIKMFLIIISLSMSSNAQSIFKANLTKSKFTWTGYAAVGNYAPTGTIQLSSGRLNFDGKNISKGIFEFDMKTISHENKDLMNHLKNEDFFDVEKYPKATFTMEKITNNQVVGLLKIKDVQKRFSFPVTIKKSENEMQIQAIISVNRTDFGIKYNSNSFFSNLGDYAIKDNFEFRLDLSMDKVIK
jgi:polyisoprenoid-binding protein YceI